MGVQMLTPALMSYWLVGWLVGFWLSAYGFIRGRCPLFAAILHQFVGGGGVENSPCGTMTVIRMVVAGIAGFRKMFG